MFSNKYAYNQVKIRLTTRNVFGFLPNVVFGYLCIRYALMTQNVKFLHISLQFIYAKDAKLNLYIRDQIKSGNFYRCKILIQKKGENCDTD